MKMITRDFLEWIEYYTEKEQTTLMILRTVGPDNTVSQEKSNQVYSVYYQNLQSESLELFNNLLYNEFTFVEFDTEEEAYQFALENFPMNKDMDLDYFVQVFIFANGRLLFANDNLKSLSNNIPLQEEPIL